MTLAFKMTLRIFVNVRDKIDREKEYEDKIDIDPKL